MHKQLFILTTFLYIIQLSQSRKIKESFYKLLNVPRNASAKKIKKSYNKLVKKFHPDRNKDRKNWAKKKFLRINKAYDTLKDPEKRKIYDQYGEEAVDK